MMRNKTYHVHGYELLTANQLSQLFHSRYHSEQHLRFNYHAIRTFSTRLPPKRIKTELVRRDLQKTEHNPSLIYKKKCSCLELHCQEVPYFFIRYLQITVVLVKIVNTCTFCYTPLQHQ